MITKALFAKLNPYQRGFIVYWVGANDDEPNVPDETNPYPPGSRAAADWDRGQMAAILTAQDGEE